MRRPSPPEPGTAASRRSYVFIHIPKAAGTSFERFLRRQFAPEDRIRGYWEEFRKQPLDELQNYRLVMGHFGYEVTHHLDEPFIMTGLRDPVDRLLSVYYFLRQSTEKNPDAAEHDPEVDKLVQLWKKVSARPLAEFLESPEPEVRAALLENPQSRQLAQATPYLLTDLTADEMHRIASRRLEAIDVVGCAEYLPATIALTGHHTGWSVPAKKIRVNVTRDRLSTDQLDRSVRRKIEKLADADMDLYRQAHRRLRTDCKALGIPLGA